MKQLTFEEWFAINKKSYMDVHGSYNKDSAYQEFKRQRNQDKRKGSLWHNDKIREELHAKS